MEECVCCGQPLDDDDVIWDENGDAWCYECAEDAGILDQQVRRAA